MTSITFRLPDNIKENLDAICLSTKRTQSYHIKEALSEYLEREAWQIAKIEKALEEAEQGLFASSEEIQALHKKWNYNES